MRLTSHATWIRVASPLFDDDDEDGGGIPGVFIAIDGSSNGQHGYRDENGEYVDDVPAGNPLKGYVHWEFYPDSYPNPGSEFSVWMGTERGSYHERWNDVYATTATTRPGERDGIPYRKHSTLQPIGKFRFSGIVDCCNKIIELTDCRPPDAYDFSEAIPEKQGPDPAVQPGQANKPRPGETSEQYWKRITQEQLGQFPYKHEGD